MNTFRNAALLAAVLLAGAAPTWAQADTAPTLDMGKAAAMAYLKEQDVYPVASNLTRYAMDLDVDIVTAFMAAGIDPNDQSQAPNTPLSMATVYACSANKGAWDRQIKTIDVLLQAGADVNYVNSAGLGILLMAAQQCPAVVVKRLLQAGAKRDQRSPQGYTPLLMALTVGNVEAARVLVDAGARASAQAIAKTVDLDEADAELKELVKKATAGK